MKAVRHLAHLLVPRASNNHKAKLLHSPTLFLLTLFVLGIQLVMNLVSTPEGSVLGYAASISIDEVITLTNQKRAEAGLPPLKHNPQLSSGALSKGQHMIAQDYWAHVAPDGTQPWKFFSDVSYRYRYAGENLARDFSNATAAVNAWMASPTHKENMLSSKYKEIGIGIVEGDLAGTDTTIIVQFFGTTMVDTLPVQPVADAGQSVATAAPRVVSTPAASPVAQPTIAPTPVPTPALTIASVEGVTGRQSQVLVSPFTTTRSLSAALVMILMVAFLIDIIVVSRRRIVRISGRSMAHIAFLGMTLAIVMIIEAGQIL